MYDTPTNNSNLTLAVTSMETAAANIALALKRLNARTDDAVRLTLIAQELTHNATFIRALAHH